MPKAPQLAKTDVQHVPSQQTVAKTKYCLMATTKGLAYLSNTDSSPFAWFLCSSGNHGVVVVALFYIHGKHLRSCPDGQLT